MRSDLLDDVFQSPPESTGPTLSVRDLSVQFGGIAALTGINLDVQRNDLTMLIGPNGAGKSTLLNAICRLVRSTGRVEFLGKPTAGRSAAALAADGIGRSFQDPPLIGRYTAIENVLCGAHASVAYGAFDQVFRRARVRQREREVEYRARALLEFMGLTAVVDTDADALSYGARKLVDIARAMISGPALLLVDEPSSGLDGEERRALQSVLSALRAARCVSILGVEHDMDLVRAVATDTIALVAGQVLVSGRANEVLDSDLFRGTLVGSSPERTDLAEEAIPDSCAAEEGVGRG